MKKKLIPLCILIGFIIASIITIYYMSARSLSLSIGKCMIATDGSYFLIDDGPTQMSNISKNENLFKGLDNGDKILVIHDGVDQSYPAQTGAYMVWKLANGDVKDLPQDILDTLKEMGWWSGEY